MKKKRHRFKQQSTLHERIICWARQVRARAEQEPPGPERDELFMKIRQAEIAFDMDAWANASDLRSSK